MSTSFDWSGLLDRGLDLVDTWADRVYFEPERWAREMELYQTQAEIERARAAQAQAEAEAGEQDFNFTPVIVGGVALGLLSVFIITR